MGGWVEVLTIPRHPRVPDGSSGYLHCCSSNIQVRYTTSGYFHFATNIAERHTTTRYRNFFTNHGPFNSDFFIDVNCSPGRYRSVTRDVEVAIIPIACESHPRELFFEPLSIFLCILVMLDRLPLIVLSFQVRRPF